MVSQRWQLQNKLIIHVTLAALVLVSSGSFYLPWSLPLRLVFILLADGAIFLTGRYLHRLYARHLVRVLVMEYDDASYIVQRALNNIKLPFRKQTANDQVRFQLRQGNMELVVESFPLNLPVDSHLATVPAARLTLSPVSPENLQLIAGLRQSVDEAILFARQREAARLMSFGD